MSLPVSAAPPSQRPRHRSRQTGCPSPLVRGVWHSPLLVWSLLGPLLGEAASALSPFSSLWFSLETSLPSSTRMSCSLPSSLDVPKAPLGPSEQLPLGLRGGKAFLGDSLRLPRPCDLLACQLTSRRKDHGQVSIRPPKEGLAARRGSTEANTPLRCDMWPDRRSGSTFFASRRGGPSACEAFS